MERRLKGICSDYTHDGKGVIKNNSVPTFVPGVLVGEEVEYLITKTNKSYNEGRLLKIIKRSPNRVEPICPNYETCGGCNIQHMNYIEQLSFKSKRVQDVLKRIAGVKIDAPYVYGMKNPYRYRNKVQVPIGCTYNGTIIGGFYHEKTHQVIDMKECYIEDETSDKLLDTIKKLLTKYEVEVADMYHHTGVLRYCVIRKSYSTNDFMVTFVTRTESFPKSKQIIEELVKIENKVKTVVQNINPQSGSVVLGNKEKVLYGDGYIFDTIQGCKFKISSHSFYQVNPQQTEVLYAKALDYAKLTGKEVVFDAYCGVGTIGLCAAKEAKEIIGVEIVPSAIIDAKENMKINNIKNASFYCEDAKDFIFKLVKQNKKIDVMFLDPPRNGCDPLFIKSVLKIKPQRIVYVSCDPSSLARDLVALKQEYNVEKVECVDMFPQTYHIETIVELFIRENHGF